MCVCGVTLTDVQMKSVCRTKKNVALSVNHWSAGQSQRRDRHCILHYASSNKQLQCGDLEGPSSQEAALVRFLLQKYIVSLTTKALLPYLFLVVSYLFCP